MPPSGRSRYPHAFSRSPIRETSQGSRRGSNIGPAPPWAYPGGEVPQRVEACLRHGVAVRAHCPQCGRRRGLNLSALVKAGLGDRRLEDLRAVCGGCGARGCAVERG